MAFASGAVSFQRFYITGDFPKDLTDAVLKHLNAKSFGRLAKLSDDTQLGWIGPRHVFETQLKPEAIQFGGFLHLAMRVDRLRAPSSVVKAYIRMEEEAALEASGKQFLSKGERKKCRDAAISRAEAEASKGDFRRISSFPVLLDLGRRMAYLANTGAAVADKLMKLFSDSFGSALEPLTALTLSERLLGRGDRARALDQIVPFRLVTPPDAEREAATNDFVSGDRAFLGKEFLSWLWFRSESDGRAIRLRSDDSATLMSDKTLRMKCDYGVSGTMVLSTEEPTSRPEAKAALRVGKSPVKLGMILGGAAGEFRFTFSADNLSISGLTVPEDKSDGDWRAQLEQRFESVSDAAALIDALFEMFLLERTARDWDDTQDAMQSWARGGGPKKLRFAAGS